MSLEGEKLSADTEASAIFVTSFNEFVEEHQLTLNRIFNCDETGLNFHLLPDKALAASFEHSADERKQGKRESQDKTERLEDGDGEQEFIDELGYSMNEIEIRSG